MRLKICDSHLTCKVANKCLNVRERLEVVEWKKMVPFLPLLSCELSVSVKENPHRKKKQKTTSTKSGQVSTMSDKTRFASTASSVKTGSAIMITLN